MLTPTHLIVCILIGMLVNLNRDEWFVALTFGVFIDLDHVFALPRYVGDNGWTAIFRPTWDDESGLPWRSMLHEPVGSLVIGYLSIGWRLMLPFLFWGVHVSMDKIQMEFINYTTPIESFMLLGATVGCLAVGYVRWFTDTGEKTFLLYISHLWSSTISLLVKKVRVTP